MSDPSINNDPIIFQLRSGKQGDSYASFTNIPYEVVDGVILLQEIPDQRNKVQIKDTSVTPNVSYGEIPSGVPSSLQYIVDYSTGIVKFNSAAEGKTLVATFVGKGIALLPSSRIWTQQSNGNVVDTLQNLIDNYITPIGTSSFTYNSDGTVHIVTLPRGTITVTYTNGNITQVIESTNGLIQTTTLTYNSDGSINTLTSS
jgi:hypothetical protein